VQGFAITLTLGIIGTLFVALIMLRNLFDWMSGPKGMEKLPMPSGFRLPRFDFVAYARFGFILSAVILLVSAAGLATRGTTAFGVDFVGGEALTADAKKMPDIAAMRSALSEAGITQTIVQPQTSPDGKITLFLRSPGTQAEQAFNALTEKFPDAGFELLSKDMVGPVVGRELREKALGALVLALIAILFYVTVRFEFSFAIASIVALAHDVILTIGIFILLGQELTLTSVGAILAIAGYSINDTIVIFDRIREMLRVQEKGSLKELFNRALNVTLSRTLLTSGTTLLAVLALYFFGGPVISPFALILLIGIIVGTYSSLFIAAPIVMVWNRNNKALLEKQVAGEQQQATQSA
jgi:SecD/SecF fusion protein